MCGTEHRGDTALRGSRALACVEKESVMGTFGFLILGNDNVVSSGRDGGGGSRWCSYRLRRY